jgi:hypothetical protein
MAPGGIDYDPGTSAPSNKVQEVMQAHEGRLLRVPGVTGVGVGQNAIGDDAIVVYVEYKSAADRLPEKIGGFELIVEVTGVIDAY